VPDIIKVSDDGEPAECSSIGSPKGATRASRRSRSSRRVRRDDLEAGFPVPHSKNI